MEKAEVLVIEDDADIREGVRILLESEGYFVKEAENGEAGLQDLSEIPLLLIYSASSSAFCLSGNPL
mgnify:CR=1 FL=1